MTTTEGLRCPLCRLDLSLDPVHSTCSGCGTTYHRGCRDELGGCGVMGCPGRTRPRRLLGWSRREPVVADGRRQRLARRRRAHLQARSRQWPLHWCRLGFVLGFKLVLVGLVFALGCLVHVGWLSDDLVAPVAGALALPLFVGGWYHFLGRRRDAVLTADLDLRDDDAGAIRYRGAACR